MFIILLVTLIINHTLINDLGKLKGGKTPLKIEALKGLSR
jgi:hypothetical protein